MAGFLNGIRLLLTTTNQRKIMEVSSNSIPASKKPVTDALKSGSEQKDGGKDKKADLSKKSGQLLMASSLGKKKMPPDPAKNNILRADTHGSTMTLRRSYGMVLSSYENVAKKGQLTSDAAEQFGSTIENRVKELNRESQRKIEDMPEYKSLKLDNIQELGEEVAELMEDPENYLKAFSVLRNPVFAELMESTESAHRSFAEMMKDNGDEKLMFGVLDMISDLGGLVGFQESTQINQNNNRVNIRV